MEYKTREDIIFNILVNKARIDDATITDLRQQLTKLQAILLKIKTGAFCATCGRHCYENETFLELKALKQ